MTGEATAGLGEVVVRDVPDRNRYEAHVPDMEHVGVANYRLRDGTIVFTHTEVPREMSGRGVGMRLARYALDDAARRGLQVIPRCPFIATVIRRHPQYAALVPAHMRAELELGSEA